MPLFRRRLPPALCAAAFAIMFPNSAAAAPMKLADYLARSGPVPHASSRYGSAGSRCGTSNTAGSTRTAAAIRAPARTSTPHSTSSAGRERVNPGSPLYHPRPLPVRAVVSLGRLAGLA
jgi:hypothetical protein